MIRMMTALDVADNSGAKKLSCISVIGVSGRKTALLADVVTASVKEAAPGSNVPKGEKVRAVVVRCAKEVRRKDGSYIKFDRNAAVLICFIK